MFRLLQLTYVIFQILEMDLCPADEESNITRRGNSSNFGTSIRLIFYIIKKYVILKRSRDSLNIPLF